MARVRVVMAVGTLLASLGFVVYLNTQQNQIHRLFLVFIQ